MCQAEDIYQKLAAVQNTIMAKDKAPKETLDKIWASTDTTMHNKENGVPAYLSFIEKLGRADGTFTASGCSVGECKLFAVLHVLTSIKPDVLSPFPKVSALGWSEVRGGLKVRVGCWRWCESQPTSYKSASVSSDTFTHSDTHPTPTQGSRLLRPLRIAHAHKRDPQRNLAYARAIQALLHCLRIRSNEDVSQVRTSAQMVSSIDEPMHLVIVLIFSICVEARAVAQWAAEGAPRHVEDLAFLKTKGGYQ